MSVAAGGKGEVYDMARLPAQEVNAAWTDHPSNVLRTSEDDEVLECIGTRTTGQLPRTSSSPFDLQRG